MYVDKNKLKRSQQLSLSLRIAGELKGSILKGSKIP
jgi:hypothetical protein